MTVVFLHSFGGWARSWELVEPSISCTTLVPNLRGFGGTPSPPGPYHVDSYVEEVLELVNDIGDFILVGHSMGGKFAMAAASRNPEGLSGLILVSPSTPTPEPMTDEDRERLRHAFGNEILIREEVSRIVKRPISLSTRETTVEGYLKVAHRAWEGWLDDGSREDISMQMCHISVPVILIAGSEDLHLGADVQRRCTLPWFEKCKFVESRCSGHLIPIEDPEVVIDSITNFRATVPKG